MQNWLPIVLAAIFFVTIIALTLTRVVILGIESQIVLVVAVFFYLLWLVVESKTTKKEVGLETTPHDCGSLELYALARGTTTIVSIATAGFNTEEYWIPAIGYAIFLMGVSLRFSAIHSLGDLYSHRVRINEQPKIVDSGPYRFIRHPAYAGMLAAHAGFLIITWSIYGLAAFLFLFVPAVIYRIRIEEAILMRENTDYEKYCLRRSRLIPLVW